MPEEIVTIRGYEVRNKQEAVAYMETTAPAFLKLAQQHDLTKFRTSERPGETFYVFIQLKALKANEAIPPIDVD